MKRTLFIVVVLVATVAIVYQAQARTVVLQGKGAVEHTITSPVLGPTVQVSKTYRNAIRLKKLRDKDIAYWNPNGGKYIDDGEYAYLWCAIFKKGKGKPSHHWVAITDDALYQALDLSHTIPQGGTAFFRLVKQGNAIALQAVTYDALHGMMQGRAVTTVKE